MDWGFADAVLALGPMEKVLSAGIRELLMKSLQSYARNLQTSEGENVDAEVFIPVHDSGFRVAPFVESPTDAHAYYAKNREVLRLILKPSAEH